MGEEEFRVRCVVSDEGNGEDKATEAMKKAHKSLIEEGFSVEWMKDSECLRINKKEKNCVYLYDPFGGKSFNHIRNLGCRIFGPLCILSSLEYKLDIPKRNVPVYNLAMKDVVVCCTNLVKQLRNELHEKVEAMGGTVSRDLTSSVTHLIAGEVGSKKYQVAASAGKQIYLPSWVNKVWEASQTKHIHGSSSQFLEYSCPIFKGLVITVSGLDSEERNQVKKAVEDEGGKYTGEMKVNECTHLIINKPKGAKYEFAKKWRINIVKSDWLYDSIEKGYCLEEKQFSLTDNSETKAEVKTSTPEKDNGPRDRMSTLADISCISNVSIIQTTHLNETSSTTQNRRSTGEFETTVESIDLTKSTSDLFLDGCKIYLSGFRGVALEKLRKVINAGGATRLNTLSENVTHAVIGERIEKDLEMLKTAAFRPHVVTPVWMAECFRQGFTVNEDPYRLPEFPPLDPQSPQVKGKKRLSDSKKEEMKEKTKEMPGSQEGDDEFSDIMSQYLLQADQGPAPSGERTVIDKAEVPVAPEVEEKVTQDPGQEIEEEEGPIFNKKVFMFYGFEEEHEKELGEYIEEKGGKILKATSRGIPDYAVVPIDGFPVDRTVNEIVTNAWLQMCLEQDQLLAVSSNVLFSPMDIKMDATPLTGCVLSVSGFAGTERDCLMHIAEILGAECQEYFVRKANKDLKASTHLVVKEAEGSKYQAAKKWNIPAISKRWIFKCAQTGVWAPEENYLIENDPPESQDPTTSVQIPVTTGAQPNDAKQSPHDQNNQSAAADDVEEDMECDKPVGAPPSTPPVSPDKTGAPSNDTGADNDKNIATNSENNETSVVMEKEKSGHGSKDKTEVWESGMETNQDDLIMLEMDPGESSRRGSQRGAERRGPTEGQESSVITESQKENIVSVKTPKLTNQRVKELKTAERETTPRNSSRRESLNESSGSLDLEKSFHPRFDFSDVLKNLETPEGQKGKQRKLGKRKSSLPFDELFEVAIHAAAKFTTEYKASETADEVDGVCDSANEDTARPLRGVVIYVSKKLSGQQAELNDLVAELGGDYKWQYDASCTHFVFQGKTNDTTKEFRVAREQKKIIVSPLWIRLCKEQNVRVDESLFPHTYNPNMTLSMVKKATPGRSSPVKSVSRRNTPQRGTRRSTRASKQSESSDVDDVPNDSPVTIATDHKSTENKSAKRGRNFSPEPDSKRQRVSSGNESVSDDKETDKQEAEFVEMGGTLDYREELAKQLKEDMAGAKTKRPQGRRKSRKLNSSGQMNMSGEGSSNDSGLQGRPGSRTNRWSMNEEQKEAQKASEVQPKEGSLPESSQTVHVMWDDPTGRLEQERLAHKLQRACSPTQDPGIAPEVMDAQFSDIEDENILPQLSENETEKRLSSPLAAPPVAFHKQSEQNVPAPQPVMIEEEKEEEEPEPTPPIFILSGMSQEERDDYGVLVESLGGKMLDGQNFDPTCTHLVIGVPARNEKFLACVASGKWVLHKSYFEACRQEGKFVQEDFYEWGGEGTVSLLDKMNPAIKKLCEAAHRWRIQINSSSQSCVGAFSEWKVILCTDRKKEDNFRRLLEAGGATVLNLKPPFNKSVSASHAFVELNKVEMSESDLVTLVKSGVVCVKPDFIAAHLTNSPAPNPEDYCPSEVKTLLQSLSGKRKISSSDDSRKRSRR